MLPAEICILNTFSKYLPETKGFFLDLWLTLEASESLPILGEDNDGRLLWGFKPQLLTLLCRK